MNDIPEILVESLRAYAVSAAARIEALEDRNDEWEQAKQEWTEAGEIYRERIEALEAALREIAGWPSSCEEARNIARAALDKDAG